MPKSSSAYRLRLELLDCLPSIPPAQHEVIHKAARHLSDLDAEICALRLIVRKVCAKAAISSNEIAKEIGINPVAIPMIHDILDT